MRSTITSPLTRTGLWDSTSYMKRLIGLLSLLPVGLMAWTAVGTAQTKGLPGVSQMAQIQGKPILSPGGPRAAAKLQVNARCSHTTPGARVAKFAWEIAAERGEAQRLDLTMFRDGFERGQFETIAQLSGTQTATASDKGDPGVNYYCRVLTLT